MPKLRDVTSEDLTAALNRAQDVQAEAQDIERRLNSALLTEIDAPISAASAFLSASRSLADLASTLLMRAALQEQKREFEARFSDRAGKKP